MADPLEIARNTWLLDQVLIGFLGLALLLVASETQHKRPVFQVLAGGALILKAGLFWLLTHQ